MDERLEPFHTKMQKSLNNLEEEFASIRSFFTDDLSLFNHFFVHSSFYSCVFWTIRQFLPYFWRHYISSFQFVSTICQALFKKFLCRKLGRLIPTHVGFMTNRRPKRSQRKRFIPTRVGFTLFPRHLQLFLVFCAI